MNYKKTIGLIKYFILLCRLHLRNRNKRVILTLLINKDEVNFISATEPEALHINISFLKKKSDFGAIVSSKVLKAMLKYLNSSNSAVYVWGYRDLIRLGIRADSVLRNVIRLEAGLLPGPKSHKGHTSYLISNKSIYFDGRETTQLEQALNDSEPGISDRTQRANDLIDMIISTGKSKYIAGSSPSLELLENPIVIIGQVVGDQAIEYTDSLCKSNVELVKNTMEKLGSGYSYYFKPHPKYENGPEDCRIISERYPSVTIIPPDVNLMEIFEKQPKVATITSGAGLEAALRGCEVHCFGVSFYSNWGFTVDHINCERRTKKFSARDVAAEIYVNQSLYLNSEGNKIITIQEAFNL